MSSSSFCFVFIALHFQIDVTKGIYTYELSEDMQSIKTYKQLYLDDDDNVIYYSTFQEGATTYYDDSHTPYSKNDSTFLIVAKTQELQKPKGENQVASMELTKIENKAEKNLDYKVLYLREKAKKELLLSMLEKDWSKIESVVDQLSEDLTSKI